MNDSRFQLKVGLFVVVGLALMALLVLNFTKGVTLFNPTYSLKINMPTTAGLKPSADVMISGVPVGKVSGFELQKDGRSVQITVEVLSKYKISRDAVFRIDALGFLGDQYVEVTPPDQAAPGDFLKNGDTVEGQPPFNTLEAVHSVAGVLDEARKTLKDVDQAITNVNHTVLSAKSLNSLSLAISNLEYVTEIAVGAAHGAADLIHTNEPPINAAIANIKAFSFRLDGLADNLEGLLRTNEPAVNEAVKNLRDASSSFKQIAGDLQSGKGPVGGLLKNDAMRAQIVSAVSNLDQVTAEFALFGSNLNQRGIWNMLWKPKHPKDGGGH